MCRARGLVSAPSNLFYPQTVAEGMIRLGQKVGFSTPVLDEKQVAELGIETFPTVGRDAAQPLHLVVACCDDDPESLEWIALVGKGTACGTDGYCLKPASFMGGIKEDMAGATTTFCALCALAEDGARVNTTMAVPTTENCTVSDSSLPGDIVGSMPGRKIETGNTDTEGRLALADTVIYATHREHATTILNITTLTGTVVSMFDLITVGLLCDDGEACADFLWTTELSDEQY